MYSSQYDICSLRSVQQMNLSLHVVHNEAGASTKNMIANLFDAEAAIFRDYEVNTTHDDAVALRR